MEFHACQERVALGSGYHVLLALDFGGQTLQLGTQGADLLFPVGVCSRVLLIRLLVPCAQGLEGLAERQEGPLGFQASGPLARCEAQVVPSYRQGVTAGEVHTQTLGLLEQLPGEVFFRPFSGTQRRERADESSQFPLCRVRLLSEARRCPRQ